jgi:glycosyltransferase involved in cell wall biosynthesis
MLVKRENLQQVVTFVGQRDDVHRLLGGADAAVHPSIREALGVALLEAMAAGLPVLAAAVDGIPEFVRPGQTGWLHTSGDVRALAEQMLEVASNSQRAREVSETGRALVQRQYDIRASVGAYESLYVRLLGLT